MTSSESVAAGDAPVMRLLRAGLLTGITDALFSSTLAAFFYGSTVTRLWQGVAATVLGPTATEGGLRTAGIGLFMHFCVAFAWATVFLLLFQQSRWIQYIAQSPLGKLKIVSVYGPCIWMVMSLAVIPLLLHRPPSITTRWWIQFVDTFRSLRCPLCTVSAQVLAPSAGSGPHSISCMATTNPWCVTNC